MFSLMSAHAINVKMCATRLWKLSLQSSSIVAASQLVSATGSQTFKSTQAGHVSKIICKQKMVLALAQIDDGFELVTQ